MRFPTNQPTNRPEVGCSPRLTGQDLQSWVAYSCLAKIRLELRRLPHTHLPSRVVLLIRMRVRPCPREAVSLLRRVPLFESLSSCEAFLSCRVIKSLRRRVWPNSKFS